MRNFKSMKKLSWRQSLLGIAICLAATTMGSCSNDDEIIITPPTADLSGIITTDVTLKTGVTYKLSGEYRVSQGAQLIIEPGVTIEATSGGNTDYILIEKGAKIMAEGTKAAPIVMTSNRKEPGAWAGLHICGDAKINLDGGTGKSEVGNANYGGLNDADNSGILSYVRVEYAGEKLNAEGTKEGNGVTFYGVGNGTTVDHVQAYKGTDDGFEFFGGCVNIKYMVSTSNSDDSFDWTQGWRGKGQFLLAYQETVETLGYECDALMECDNLENNNANEPISHPTLANVTLIGNNSSTEKRGIRLRAGTEISLYNTIVTNKVKCITTQTAETEAALTSGKSVLQFIYLANTLTSESDGYSAALFAAGQGNAIDQTFVWTDTYVGTIDGGKDMTTIDTFFDNATYIGAVKAGNNWTEGWTL